MYAIYKQMRKLCVLQYVMDSMSDVIGSCITIALCTTLHSLVLRRYFA